MSKWLTNRLAFFITLAGLVFLLAAGLHTMNNHEVHAQVISLAQTYYVPLDEVQLLDLLPAMEEDDAVSGVGVETIVSIAATADHTVILYDQHEDGYDASLTLPDPDSSTQIWGDGRPSNGHPPDIPNDIIMAGDVITLQNVISRGRVERYFYDGGDRISASNPIFVTRSFARESANEMPASAMAVYGTNYYGNSFIAPVGEDIGADGMFDNTWFNCHGVRKRD